VPAALPLVFPTAATAHTHEDAHLRFLPTPTPTPIPTTPSPSPTPSLSLSLSPAPNRQPPVSCSAGFRVSRGKMADLIKGGDVRLNWKGGVKSSADVKAGDVISCAGKGRVEVRGCEINRKGRYVVQLVRFV
jgi:hypothetical protein